MSDCLWYEVCSFKPYYSDYAYAWLYLCWITSTVELYYICQNNFIAITFIFVHVADFLLVIMD